MDEAFAVLVVHRREFKSGRGSERGPILLVLPNENGDWQFLDGPLSTERTALRFTPSMCSTIARSLDSS
jgi:hypothetical protein